MRDSGDRIKSRPLTPGVKAIKEILQKSRPCVSGVSPAGHHRSMKQVSLDLSLSVKKTRKREFLEQMDKVVPWPALIERGLLLKTATVVDATLIAAPSSTKNNGKARDPEMHSSQKGNQWHFGMKAHIGADADSGLVHTVRGTSGNVHDVLEGSSLLHGQEVDAYGDAGYQGIHKRPDAKPSVTWHVAMRPGKRRALDKSNPLDQLTDQVEKAKAGIRAKVEHPFRVIKRQFGYVKTRYRGLKKNTAQLVTLFALSNLWMVRTKLQGARG